MLVMPRATTKAEYVDSAGGPVPRPQNTRRCIVTRRTGAKAEMVRFVVDPAGIIVPDVEETLPGRGLWLLARRDIVADACRRSSFAKAARAAVTAPQALADDVERLLVRRALGLIGLARRAGEVVAGFESVREWLRHHRAGVLLTARDAAAGGADKLRALAPGVARLGVFDSAELGRALGRESAMHAAVAPGRLAEALLREGARLAGFRGTASAADCLRDNEKA